MANRTGKLMVEPKNRYDRKVSNAAIKAGGTPASASTAGVVKQGVAVPNAAGATPTKAEFDALLASLRTAGVIAP